MYAHRTWFNLLLEEEEKKNQRAPKAIEGFQLTLPCW